MKYRKIDPRIWNDAKFRQLTDDGKLVFLFVLTHPSMTALGAMRATVAGLAAELAWPARRFRRALEPAVTLGMVETNEGAAYLGLPNFLRYNDPDGPNSVVAWVGAVGLIPECAHRARLVARCRAHLDAKPEKWRLGVAPEVWATLQASIADGSPHPSTQPLPDPFDIPEQEQEQEKEGTTPKPPGGASEQAPTSWIDLLNRETGRDFKPTKANVRPIRARIREGYTFEQAEVVVKTKSREWANTDQAQYLRPLTLFGPKFDSYLQASKNGPRAGFSRTIARRVNDAWDGQQAGEVTW